MTRGADDDFGVGEVVEQGSWLRRHISWESTRHVEFELRTSNLDVEERQRRLNTYTCFVSEYEDGLGSLLMTNISLEYQLDRRRQFWNGNVDALGDTPFRHGEGGATAKQSIYK